MKWNPNKIDNWRALLIGLLGIAGTTITLACASSRQATQLAIPSATMTLRFNPTPSPLTPTIQSSDTPTKTAAHNLLPSATSTLTPAPTWTPFQTSLDAYGMSYDKNATPRIPPRYSLSMWIWGEAIPASPVASTPQFISYPTSELSSSTDDLLIEAGCEKPSGHYDLSCAQDSPLTAFGCFFITDPKRFYFRPAGDLALVAGCDIMTEEGENPPEGTIFIAGCAFKFKHAYIFKDEGKYVLIDTIEGVNDLFVPIESPAEALTYALMRTGLHSYIDLSYDPTLLYLQKSIEGTHVTEEAGDYEMNLYHVEGCGCEPWITSQVNVSVDRNGSITWNSAIPVYMTTGFGCAD